jgi:hypothetical protein
MDKKDLFRRLLKFTRAYKGSDLENTIRECSTFQGVEDLTSSMATGYIPTLRTDNDTSGSPFNVAILTLRRALASSELPIYPKAGIGEGRQPKGVW